MPSDDRTQAALDALAGALEPYRAAVAGAVAQVGAVLDRQRLPADGRAERARHELGGFAAGRMDATRFAAVFGAAPAAAPDSLAQLERAHHALRHVAGRADTMFASALPPGRELLVHVAHALAEVGRAFGAARAFELARRGRPGGDELDGYIGGFAFRRWNRAERQIAPPLVVELDGADAQAGGLAEFLDGRQKIVLVVRGECPPAPLARLLSPGVLVMQTDDAAELAALAAHDGPAIAALVPEGAARFVHRPGPAGPLLEVRHLPAEPAAAIGRCSRFQQAEELALLRAVALTPRPPLPHAEEGEHTTHSSNPLPPVGEGGSRGTSEPGEGRSSDRPGEGRPTGRPGEGPSRSGGPGEGRSSDRPGEAPAVADPADRLAAWLLGQAGLAGG